MSRRTLNALLLVNCGLAVLCGVGVSGRASFRSMWLNYRVRRAVALHAGRAHVRVKEVGPVVFIPGSWSVLFTNGTPLPGYNGSPPVPLQTWEVGVSTDGSRQWLAVRH